MAQIEGTTFSVELRPGEQICASFVPRGLHAGNHGQVLKPFVVLTNRRFVALTQVGPMTKRLEDVES
jgi:hypothetical protein